MFLIFGKNGQLGKALQEEAGDREIVFLGRAECDITNRESVANAIKQYKPDIIINAAAYTNVDGAEVHKKLCFETNVLSNIYISEFAEAAKVIYISSNYVFNGEDKQPYTEYLQHLRPLNYYGYTKLSGELYQGPSNAIIRTAGLYGDGVNFVNKIIYNALKFGEIKVSDDITNLTYANDLAKNIFRLIDEKKIFGTTKHMVNKGAFSWLEFAEEILSYAKLNVKISKREEESYILAKRPRNGALATIYDDYMPSYKASLKKYIEELGNEKEL